MWKPCIDCGAPSPGTRCAAHQQARDARAQASQTAARKRTGGRSKYGGRYQGGARAVRSTATVCWLCLGPADPHDPWQADHIIQGDRWGDSGALAPAHRSCNIRRRHLAGRGWAHDRIVERLKLLRHGPPPAGEGASPLPGQIPAAGNAK
jgi:hypothetical protein